MQGSLKLANRVADPEFNINRNILSLSYGQFALIIVNKITHLSPTKHIYFQNIFDGINLNLVSGQIFLYLFNKKLKYYILSYKKYVYILR